MADRQAETAGSFDVTLCRVSCVSKPKIKRSTTKDKKIYNKDKKDLQNDADQLSSEKFASSSSR